MFVVLFEVEIKPSQWDRYLELAARLRPELVRIPGFVDNERYRSEHRDLRLLSLSTWKSEKALVRWRAHGLHHEVQGLGRFEVFADYHLRVGEVVVDTATRELPQTRLDVTAAGEAPVVTVTEAEPGAGPPPVAADGADVVEVERYTGITTEGKRVGLISWRRDEAAAEWLAGQAGDFRHRRVRVIRDYGLRDRAEAPQHFAPVPGVA